MLGIDRRAIRPRRGWFVVAVLIAAIAVLAAMLLLRFAPGGTVEQRFAVGQPVRVTLSPSRPSMIWARVGDPVVPDLRCKSRALGFDQDSFSQVQVGVAGNDGTVEREAFGERWRGVSTVASSPAGSYELTCTSDQPGGASASLAIGDAPRFLDPRSRLLGGLTLLSIVVVGSGTAVAIALVVAARRRASEARLREQSSHAHS